MTTLTTRRPTATAAVDIADVLHAAAVYLEAHGWYQGDLYDPAQPEDIAFPRACAIGAIRLAVHGSLDAADLAATTRDGATVTATVAYLATFVDDGNWDPADNPNAVVGDWNDAPGRTRDQVTDTLHAIAAAYRLTHRQNHAVAS